VPGRLPFSNNRFVILDLPKEFGRKKMNEARTEQRSGPREIIDSPLLWITILMYGVAFCAYLWSDFLRVFRWMGL
jgi:hypothetical protein